MSQPAYCPSCQTPLAADALGGMCPACLLSGGKASGDDAGVAITTPGTDSKVTAAIADLASRFPQLEILELLGQGGMGAVYKARQKHLDRFIALKVIPPVAAEDPAFAERFAREARALARLNHPNIVTVYDFGQSDGVYFLLMEFVDGLNLRQTMRAGKLSPREALAIVPHVCDALQYAHDLGVVHRDVKPENVLLDKSGRVKIADFGLAKLLARSPLDFTLTQTAQVMGTPRYMAPEQIEHPTEVDHRADIYSLGVMFYEMLTGELPMGNFARPSQKAEIDVRIDEIVLRALEREPTRRYQHASEVKTELETVASSSGSPGKLPAREHGEIAAVKQQLYGPGMALAVGGVIGLLSCFLVLISMISLGIAGPQQVPGFSEWMSLHLVSLIVSFPWSLFMLLAALKMLRVESYRLSLAGAWLALLPVGLPSVIAVPAGIWALVVLTSRQARAAFRRNEELDASGEVPATNRAVSARLSSFSSTAPTSVRRETPATPAVIEMPRSESVDSSPAALVKPAPAEAAPDPVRRSLQAPGFGLYVGGVLALTAPVSWLLFLLMLPTFATGRTMIGKSDWQLFLGYSSAAILVSIPFAVVMIIGGVNLRQVGSYRLAWFGGVAAVFPFCVGWPLSLPFGFWALMTLLRPEVETAFGVARMAVPGQGAWARSWAFLRWLVIAIVSYRSSRLVTIRIWLPLLAMFGVYVLCQADVIWGGGWYEGFQNRAIDGVLLGGMMILGLLFTALLARHLLDRHFAAAESEASRSPRAFAPTSLLAVVGVIGMAGLFLPWVSIDLPTRWRYVESDYGRQETVAQLHGSGNRRTNLTRSDVRRVMGIGIGDNFRRAGEGRSHVPGRLAPIVLFGFGILAGVMYLVWGHEPSYPRLVAVQSIVAGLAALVVVLIYVHQIGERNELLLFDDIFRANVDKVINVRAPLDDWILALSPLIFLWCSQGVYFTGGIALLLIFLGVANWCWLLPQPEERRPKESYSSS